MTGEEGSCPFSVIRVENELETFCPSLLQEGLTVFTKQLKFTVAVPLVFHTGSWVIRQQQFGEHLARAFNFFAVRLDFHASLNLTNTSGLRHPRAFDINRTYPTNRDGVKSRIMTQDGDFNAQSFCCIPDRCAFRNTYCLAVDRQGD